MIEIKKQRNDKTWKSNIIIYYSKLEVPHGKKSKLPSNSQQLHYNLEYVTKAMM